LKITIEPETPNDSSSMFRVLLDDKLIGADLTAVQAQLVVAEIIERFVLQPRITSSSAKVAATVPNLLLE
jgi:hypothetical protein